MSAGPFSGRLLLKRGFLSDERGRLLFLVARLTSKYVEDPVDGGVGGNNSQANRSHNRCEKRG